MPQPFSWLDQAQLPEPTAPVDVTTTGGIDDLPALDLAGNLVSALRFTGAGAVTLNGLQVGSGVTYGRRIHLMAVGGALTLANNAGTSQGVNRIVTGTGANVVIGQGGAAWLVYDLSAQVWRLSGGSGGGGGSATPGGSSGQVQWNSSGSFAGASFITTDGSTWMGLGTGTLHTTAKVRLPYAATDVIVGAKDSVGNDQAVISRTAADTYLFGPATAANLNMTFQGNLVNILANSTLVVKGATGSYVSLGTATTVGDVRLPNAGTIYGRGPGGEDGRLIRYGSGGVYVLEVGETANVGEVRLLTSSSGSVNCVLGSTYVLQVTPTAILTAVPITGFAAANMPLRFGVATVTGAPTSVTATAAQYANPKLIVTTGTAAAAFKLVLPLVAGTEYSVLNNSTFTLTVGGATGATVSIAAGALSKCECLDGANFNKVA